VRPNEAGRDRQRPSWSNDTPPRTAFASRAPSLSSMSQSASIASPSVIVGWHCWGFLASHLPVDLGEEAAALIGPTETVSPSRLADRTKAS
jgi:hypothetical protein